jgi:hypothetical protein
VFEVVGRHESTLEATTQSVDEYIESIHSMNGFSRQRMSLEDAMAFDDAARAVLIPYAEDGLLTFEAGGSIVWGKPLTR